MPGTKLGGRRMIMTMTKKMGGPKGLHKFYQMIGREGGRLSRTGGFASEKVGLDGLTGRQRAVVAGVKGGRISKRPKDKILIKSTSYEESFI